MEALAPRDVTWQTISKAIVSLPQPDNIRQPRAHEIVMRFSELDLARLGLSTEAGHRPASAQNQSQPWDQSFPRNWPQSEDPIAETSSDRGVLSGRVSSSADAQASFFTLSPHLTGPSLSQDCDWQAPSWPPQQSSAQDHLSGAGSRSGNEIWTPTGKFVGIFQDLPGAGDQQSGLPRRRSRYFRRQQGQSTLPQPINVPGSASADTALDPMQRWRASPPEAEAASLACIADALKNTPLRARSSAASLTSQRSGSRAASTISGGSGTSYSSASNASASSAALRGSNHRSRGRVAKRTPARGNNKDKRIFPCTFCCDSFKSKYDWARHEKSLHLNLEGWRCAPFGGTVVSSDTERVHCAYCNVLDPDAEHLESHNHGACENGGRTSTFSRKDHLVQHLRLVHHIETLPLIDSWKDEGPPVSSRCGFCDIRMPTWKERVDHLAKHFRMGATMHDWKGEHCFEPSIAAKVTHAIAPYLIGPESRAVIPFSVTDHGTTDHLSQIRQATEQTLGMWEDKRTDTPTSCAEPSPESMMQAELQDALRDDTSSMTFPEILALHLGRYSREQMRLGVIPTDKMFQDEARRIVFDSVDPLDQTIADNDDWLSRFRDRHLKNTPENREDQT